MRDWGRDQSAHRGKGNSSAWIMRRLTIGPSSRLSLRSYVPIYLEIANIQIDFDSSASDDRICIRAGIDPELDQWRNDYACASLRFQFS
jgi:hypothetical protein